MKEFMEWVRTENPGLVVMVRPDSRSLRLNAFTKVDGENSWSRYHESCPIPIGIMLSNQATLASASVAGAAAAGAASVAPAVAAMGVGGQEEGMNSS